MSAKVGMLMAQPDEDARPEPQVEERVGWETTCWGCGLRLVLPKFAPMFRCGWCGAISVHNPEIKSQSRWNRICTTTRDRIFVFCVLLVIFSIVSGGVWSAFPVLFPRTSVGFLIHSVITAILAFNTLFNFCVSAFIPAGPPARVDWGHYEVVGRNALEGYKLCFHCNLPKPPNAHHCRSCGSCVVDMDHHCPFIGNCVGANNHKNFILFLVCTTLSCFYLLVMSTCAGSKLWPKPVKLHHGKLAQLSVGFNFQFLSNVLTAVLFSTDSVRALALIYLSIAALALLIGVGLLLHQQLHLLYNGETFIDSLSSGGWMDRDFRGGKGWANLGRVFGKRHPVFWLLPRITLGTEIPQRKIHLR